MSENKHGLDSAYFKKNLKQLVRDVESYKPEEMALALSRLSVVASPSPVEPRAKGITPETEFNGMSLELMLENAKAILEVRCRDLDKTGIINTRKLLRKFVSMAEQALSTPPDTVGISRECAEDLLQQVAGSYETAENIHGDTPEEDWAFMELKEATQSTGSDKTEL